MDKILIVDDEVVVCDLLKNYLTLKGYEVYTASDGYTAINKVKEVCPHLVLLDIVMPGISGIQLLKEIKKLNPKTGVIMITAVPDQGIITESIDLGAYDCIRKPMDLKHVENVVMIAIKNGKRSQNAEIRK
ncbi:MAG: response regulator [Desulfobacterales bacterium]|nr:response regulator [Desulfobacterales bacterium]MDX2508900.1 response regulator [Desulfobacterales bacterium]